MTNTSGIRLDVPAPKASSAPSAPLSGHHVVVRTNAAQSVRIAPPPNGRGGILGTARSSTGEFTNKIDDNSRVTVTTPSGKELTTTAKAAALIGLVGKNAGGEYVEASPEPEGSEEPEKDPYENSIDPLAPPPLEEHADRIETDIYQSLVSSGLDPVQVAAQVLSSGHKLDSNLENFARSHGVSPSQFSENLSTIHQAHQDRVEAFMRGRQVDPAEVWKFEEQIVPRERALAGRLRYLQGDLSYFEGLVRQYVNIKGNRRK
jgi:hypothetical protein